LQVLIDEPWRGRRWVVETDIANCFEAIPVEKLMQAVEERVCDQSVLKLRRAILRAGVMQDGQVRRSVTGTGNGAPWPRTRRRTTRWETGGPQRIRDLPRGPAPYGIARGARRWRRTRRTRGVRAAPTASGAPDLRPGDDRLPRGRRSSCVVASPSAVPGWPAATSPLRIVHGAWQLRFGSALTLPEVEGKWTLQIRLLNAYMDRLLATAEHHAVVAGAVGARHRSARCSDFAGPPSGPAPRPADSPRSTPRRSTTTAATATAVRQVSP
jgi:hypothetical protein